MPCDSGPGFSYYEEAKAATQAACDALTKLESLGRLEELDIQTQAWWEVHKIQDRKRKEAEARRAEEERLRQEALEKLTPEQRRLLGLR